MSHLRSGKDRVAEEENAELFDTDFKEYVRSAFEALLSSVSEIKSTQDTLVARLNTIDDSTIKNTKDIEELSKSVEFNSESLSANGKDIKALVEKVKSLEVQVADANRVALEARASCNQLERHSRGFNVRLLGVKEVPQGTTEDCVNVLESVLEEKFNLSGHPIEHAHRVGKGTKDHPRAIIGRFFSRRTRSSVMKRTKECLGGTPYRLVDDLTGADMAEKKRIRPLMDNLYHRGKRPSFRQGRLFADGKYLSSEQVNAFLANPDLLD